jgi:hypothetical protein
MADQLKSECESISECEVCGSTELLEVLDLGSHPMCDDLIEVGSDNSCLTYPIKIVFCKHCKTAHQRYQIPKKILFSDNYHYRSRFTADVMKGMDNLVVEAASNFGDMSECTVVDIGCNDGSLLEKFRALGATTVGVEPTGAGADAISKADLVINDYFSEEVALKITKRFGSPDLIVFTNVFAHIEDLKGLLTSLKAMIGPNTRVIIENHYLGSILKDGQFDTFYHEHPRTYSLSSFLEIAKSLQLELTTVDFPSRYGGNIRVALSKFLPDEKTIEKIASVITNEMEFDDAFSVLSNNMNNWKSNKKRQILKLVEEHGPLISKAFPGRAAILITLLGLDERHISKTFEQPGSPKVGHYVPGTRIPIESDEKLFEMKPHPGVILNLAWHISEEITGYLRANQFEGEVIDIMSVADF